MDVENIIDFVRGGNCEAPSDIKSTMIFGDTRQPVFLSEPLGLELEAYMHRSINTVPFSQGSKAAKFGKTSNSGKPRAKNFNGNRTNYPCDYEFTRTEAADKDNDSNRIWLVKNNQWSRGLFTDEEMQHIVFTEDSYVKRIFDPVYIKYSDVESLGGNFFCKTAEIDALIKVEHDKMSQLTDEIQRMGPIRKDDNIKVTNCQNEGRDTHMSEINSRLSKCRKSILFLNNTKSKLDIFGTVKKIYNKSYRRSIELLEKYTGMAECSSKDFLMLVCTESQLPICKDIDEEGFLKA